MTPVRVGQTWASRDRRDLGRRVVVEQVGVLGGHVIVRGARRSRMRIDTLTRRYRLVVHPRIVTTATTGDLL